MSAVEDHYRNLLAQHYSWMFGLSFEDKAAEQRAILEPLLAGRSRGPAVDLGSGPGFQSVALTQLGFSPVLAIDTSEELLAELRLHSAARSVRTHRGDILGLGDLAAPASVEVIVCMGDTLTHLPSLESVRQLFRSIATALAPGGLLLLTWRDLTGELTGADRFIPVRSDENTVMTCFLEFTSPTTVQVHDLVYTRDAASRSWTFNKSSYPKLRLSPTWVGQTLAAAGLEPLFPGTAGRLCLLAAKHAANLKSAR